MQARSQADSDSATVRLAARPDTLEPYDELSFFASLDGADPESGLSSVLGLLQRLRQGGGIESVAAALQRCEAALAQRVQGVPQPSDSKAPGPPRAAPSLRPGEAEAQQRRGHTARRLVLDTLRSTS